MIVLKFILMFVGLLTAGLIASPFVAFGLMYVAVSISPEFGEGMEALANFASLVAYVAVVMLISSLAFTIWRAARWEMSRKNAARGASQDFWEKGGLARRRDRIEEIAANSSERMAIAEAVTEQVGESEDDRTIKAVKKFTLFRGAPTR